MIDFIKRLFTKETNKPHLYIYYTTFTIINDVNQIVTSISFDRKLMQAEKVTIRRNLNKQYPDCKVKVFSGYRTYLGNC